MSSTSAAVAPRVVAIAGGKGGSGKSLLAANLGIYLATFGKRVVLVDAAFGCANLHIFVGADRPTRSLSEALGRNGAELSDLADTTPVPGLRLVAGVGDPAWVASPKAAQTRRLIEGLRALDADYVVVDLPPGTASQVLDVFLAADVGILIAVPEPTSIELTYRFIRAAFVRRLRKAGLADLARVSPDELRVLETGIPSPVDLYLRARENAPDRMEQLEAEILAFRPHLVINGVRSKADMELGRAAATAARRRLGVPVLYLGHLEYDEAVWVAVRRRRPLLVEHPESRVSKCIEKVTRRLMATASNDGVPATGDIIARESYYELLDVAPTASFEDIRRANRRIREIYAPDSVVISGLYTEAGLEEIQGRLEEAYTVLMDAASRKAYDQKLFPDGIPSSQAPAAGKPVPVAPTKRIEAPPVERPPMPELGEETDYTGALLQQVREASGIDLREIAERTKIGMGYLTALESETYKKLPAPVYVRGFLVEYCKILGIDAGRVLATYLERFRRARTDSDAADEQWR